MSRDGSTTFVWGDGEHRFRLAIGQLRELQEKTDAGPQQVFNRLRLGDWRVDDVRETLRLGLIGGGAPMDHAHKLVARYVDDYGLPLLEHVPAALGVLTAALIGAPDEDDDAEKRKAAKAKRKASASPSPRSTAPAPSSDGRPLKSTTSRSGSSRSQSTAGTKPRAAKLERPTP